MHRSSIFYAPSFLGAAILFLLGAELNTTSTSPSLNPLQEQILKKCGNLCDYIDYCINSNHFDDSEFMLGVCDMMVQEVIYLNDEEKVLQIAPRYMRHFHNYELDKHITRPKRSSRKKDQHISGVPTSYFISVVDEFRLTDIIFLLDKNDNHLVRNMKGIEGLSKRFLGKSVFVRFLHTTDIEIKESSKVANNTTNQQHHLNVSNIDSIVHSSRRKTSSVEDLSTKSAFFVISETSSMQNVVSYFAKLGYINSGVMWFFNCKDCTNTTNSDSLPSTFLPNATIGIDSTFYVFGTPEEDRSGDSVLKVYEAYKLMNTWKRKHWARWSSNYGLEVTKVTIWERRGDLSGVVLRCASAGSPPMAIVEKLTGDKKGQIRITGFLADIWNGIQDVANFTYTMVETIDGGWGSPKDDGTWTGMIGMILRDEVDIAISDFYVTAERSMVIDYSQKIVELMNQMFIKSPGAGVGWGTFVTPMTIEMWICTLLMTIIGSFVVTVTYYIGKKFNDVEDLPFTFGSVIFMSFSFFFQQGTEYDPQRGATRVALLSILAMMVIIFACYSAQMTAVLSVANVVMPFENVQGMYRDTNYKVGSVENTAFDNLFNTPNELDQKVFKERYVKVKDLDAGIQKALDDEYAFIWATESINVMVGQDCSHVAVKQSVMNAIVAWPAREKWPYLKLVDYFLSKMAESGQISRIWKRWKADARDDCFEVGADDMGLGIINLFTAPLMLGILMIIACLIALIECLWFKKFGNKYQVSKEEEEATSLKDSWNSSADSAKFYEKKKAATKSALAKEWFELAFGQ